MLGDHEENSALSDLTEDELIELLASDRVLKTKRAFCLMFTNSLYQMHLNILSALLQATRTSQHLESQ